MPIAPIPEWGLPPADVAQELAGLSDTLDARVPPKQLDRNLIVASWNIRELGRSNGQWTTDQGKSPKRNRGDIYFIAEILSRFDVVAVQEVQDNLSALREVMRCLGTDWGFQVTDVTEGTAADHERLAFLYDLRRVRPSGLAGELVLSPEDLDDPDADDDDPLVGGQVEQLVKTPYVMSFMSAGRPFVLATVHVIWGDGTTPRAREAEALAKMLQRVVKPADNEASSDFRTNLIALGDFNITSPEDEIFSALVANGLQPDIGTLDKPRTTRDTGPASKFAYDQLAWFSQPRNGWLRFERLNGDTFPWDDPILVDAPGDTTFRISDHYPLWIEFSVREAA
jgi:endonuclease/exonuclease/phosphatase family metal-dependent hydrolase